MTSPVLFDIESQSRADLETVGGRAYWRHPSTHVLVAAWYDTASGDVGLWHPGDPWPHHGRTLAAHNASGFDRFGAYRQGWMTPGDAWIDTSELARTAGLPGALDALGTRWLGLPKDKAASAYTRSLSSVRRPAKGPGAISAEEWRTLSDTEKRERGAIPEITPEVMARVDPYCLLDVEIMAEGWERLSQWLDLEPDVVAVDRIVNDRGVPLDRELCEALLECDRINAEIVLDEVAAEMSLTPAEVRAMASSNQQFCAATGAPNAQKETVAALDHPLARARRATASIARGKLEAGLARVCPDGRLRDSHRYYGGHTGRWSGKGMQLQNLPRPDKRYEDWSDDQICRLADAVKAGDHLATQGEVNLLLRGTIHASPGKTFAVCDFSGVEARALAWVAGDHKALDVFREGTRDPYKVAAAIIFGKSYEQVDKADRLVGKIAELACGYGQGGRKFAETAAKMGANLEAIGVDSFAVVAGWRKLHAPSVRLWYACEDAFRQAIAGHVSAVACFDFRPSDDGKDVAVFLPSGRPIVYPGARLKADGRKGSIVFDGGVTGEEYTYGGKIVENLIQALCRDLMARALVAAEDAGLSPVMHVHDEIVCEVDEAVGDDGLACLRAWMLDLPDWAVGFPIGAAGFVGRRYRK